MGAGKLSSETPGARETGRPGPACVVWELTLACNLKCLHCGSSAGGARGAELSTGEALALCEDLKRSGARGVALMGGEPQLRRDFWEIAAHARAQGLELSVITNGTVSGEDTFSRLNALSPRAVAVSVDAADPALHDRIRGAPGACAKAWEFIEQALAAGLPVSVITTVHKLNLGELAALREKLKGRGIAWQVQTAGAEGARFPRELLLTPEEFYSVGIFVESCRRNFTPEELPAIGAHDLGYNPALLSSVSLYEKWEGCQAGVSVAGVRSDGAVLGCLALNDERFVEGNVRERPFSEIWRDPAAFGRFRSFRAADAGPNCAGCAELEKCRGGCSEMSLMKTGALHNDPYCFKRLEPELFPGGSGCLPGGPARGSLFRRLGRIFGGRGGRG